MVVPRSGRSSRLPRKPFSIMSGNFKNNRFSYYQNVSGCVIDWSWMTRTFETKLVWFRGLLSITEWPTTSLKELSMLALYANPLEPGVVSARAGRRQGCIIWPKFAQTRIGHLVACTNSFEKVKRTILVSKKPDPNSAQWCYFFLKKGAQAGGRTWDLFGFRLFSLSKAAA